MKNLSLSLFLLCCLTLSAFSQESMQQETERKIFYPTVNVITALPMNDFRNEINRKMLWGFNADGVFIPFKNAPFYQPGFQLEFLFHGKSKDNWNGIDVKTQSMFMNINLVNRIRLFGNSAVSPFIEGAFGMKLSTANTTYDVVDKATFYEKFFLNEEDQVETHSVNQSYDLVYDMSLGVGFVINGYFTLQVKYNYSPLIKFVKKENIVVENNTITYNPSYAEVNAIVISLGISFEKAKRVY